MKNNKSRSTCLLGGDPEYCEDCIYGADYHYVDGECVEKDPTSKVNQIAKDLCDKSGCHHKCHDTKDCVVEDDAEEVIANYATTTDKQIEEITKALNEKQNGGWKFVGDSEFTTDVFNEEVAKYLYEAGYRKQNEGEWIDLYKGKYANPTYSCSVCGKGTLLTHYVDALLTPTVIQALSPYCPHCGSKMKGGE